MRRSTRKRSRPSGRSSSASGRARRTSPSSRSRRSSGASPSMSTRTTGLRSGTSRTSRHSTGTLCTVTTSGTTRRTTPPWSSSAASTRRSRCSTSLDRVEAVLDREVEKLRKAPPPKAELARARAQVRAWARYEQDGVTFQGILLSAGEGLGSWDFGEALLAKIENVRAEQIRAVARTYLVDDHRTVVRFHAQEVPA